VSDERWLVDVRSGPLCGLKSDISRGPRSAPFGLMHRSKQHLYSITSSARASSDGGVSVEAGLMEMLSRMETGRFKVFKELNDRFEEFRLYHRKDGKVVKERDDLMSATRYAVMMLRDAKTLDWYDWTERDIVYPPLGIY
jgi:hypothetical protein